MFPCNRCQVCPLVDRTDTFQGAIGQNGYKIRDLINCSTMRVIYMITCPKIYIGETKRPLKVRIGEHLREFNEKDPEKSLAKHFSNCHGGCTEGVRVKGIYVLTLPPRRGDFNRIFLQKEKWWIYRLKYIVSVGLNTLNLQVFLES